jgi:predicted transcriptional regulator
LRQIPGKRINIFFHIRTPMTGETQLRARRTRMKILKAIADRNGSAGFSEIKDATALSTGSIYYHLERMVQYVKKSSKHYHITSEGMQLLEQNAQIVTPLE